MATGRSYLGKWRSFFIPLMIQTTTTCLSNQLFDTVPMVTSNNSFYGLYVKEHVQAVIEAMSTAGVSGYSLTLVNT